MKTCKELQEECTMIYSNMAQGSRTLSNTERYVIVGINILHQYKSVIDSHLFTHIATSTLYPHLLKEHTAYGPYPQDAAAQRLVYACLHALLPQV